MSDEENDATPEGEDNSPNGGEPNKTVRIKNNSKYKKILLLIK